MSGNPDRKFVLTFDDGYENVFRNALPLLVENRFRAIQYLVTDLIGKRNEWDIRKGDAAEPLMDRVQIKDAVLIESL